MKEYLVIVDCIQWGRYYIVSANNAKEAVDKVYDSHFAWRKNKIGRKVMNRYLKKSSERSLLKNFTKNMVK